MASTTIVDRRLFPIVLIFSGSLALLLGCANVPVAAEPAQHAAPAPSKLWTQVIVKFSDPALDPTRPEYLKDLARNTGAVLVYIRPMSGGAHVLQVEGVVDAGHFQRIVDELSKRPGVEYAEADRRMHPMPRR